ncbi:MAG TPA: hypothetical protein VK824_00935 [Planctomycetota bacterium]|nr:hypothetical protein [Planctomycetota bacterium]
MAPRPHSLLRWLRMAVAVLALLGGEGTHELLHRESWSAHAAAHAASGQLEIHAGDCQHRQDVHEPHGHDCLFCKAGHAQDLLAPLLTLVPAAARTCCRIETRAEQRAPSAGFPGTLGARGPPVTTV